MAVYASSQLHNVGRVLQSRKIDLLRSQGAEQRRRRLVKLTQLLQPIAGPETPRPLSSAAAERQQTARTSARGSSIMTALVCAAFWALRWI